MKEEHENYEMRNGRFKKDSTQTSRDKNKMSKIKNTLDGCNRLDTKEEKNSEHKDIEKGTIRIDAHREKSEKTKHL